ncbi:MAG: serine/threonine-protein kinase, partial [Myxococcota bacterium]|nr:serine/threonine-protein kinase [Myxococcota bacterium]
MQRLSDRYSLGDLIGKGGVGEVYQGWQTALDRPVAIKLLRQELTRNAAAVARFEREARTTSLLHHPNVVTVFDVGTKDDGRRFVVMELLGGESLADLLDRRERLPVDETLHIAGQIVRGMGAGQGVGLVHRDLKPDNLFVLEGMHVKVLDFGLAVLTEGEEPSEPVTQDPTEPPDVAPADVVDAAKDIAGAPPPAA